MPAKKAAKKAAAKKEAPEKEPQIVEPQASAAKEASAPAKKAAKKAATKEAAPKAEKSVPKPPKDKDVAKAAYLNYLNRKSKGLPGSAESDWLAAEKSEGS